MGYIFFKKTRARSAVDEGDFGKLKALLDKGLPPDTKEEWDRSLIVRAIEKSRTDMVGLLLERGAKIPLDIWYGSALHVAAARGNIDVAKMFLEKDVKLLLSLDRDGNTPLHIASKKGHEGMAGFLLEKGADPFVKNDDGYDALFLSDTRGYKRVSDILLKYRNQMKSVAESAVPAAAKGGAGAFSVPAENEHGSWRKISNEKIALIVQEKELGYKLIDVFNFSRGECLRIVQNTRTEAESHETKYFDDMRGQHILEEAFNELEKRGTTLNRNAVQQLCRKGIQKPPGI